MFTMQIWLKRKAGMSEEEFRRYWLEEHAPISRDGYQHMKGYVVSFVTGAPKGQEPVYDGLAELTWDDRDGFVADMRSEVAQRGSDDLANFTEASGVAFVEQHVVK